VVTDHGADFDAAALEEHHANKAARKHGNTHRHANALSVGRGTPVPARAPLYKRPFCVASICTNNLRSRLDDAAHLKAVMFCYRSARCYSQKAGR
jgi:hypothetical protein